MFDYIFEEKEIPVEVLAIEESVDKLPESDDIDQIMPLIWSEHCLECSAPECYNSCNLYEANRYGRCKRTVYGGRTYKDENLLFPATQLKYKKWGKLRCRFNMFYRYEPQTFLRKYNRYLKLRNQLFRLGEITNYVRDEYKDLPARLFHHRFIKKYAAVSSKTVLIAEELFFAFYSLESQTFTLILTVSNKRGELCTKLCYEVVPGFNIWRIHNSELNIVSGGPFALELYPYNNFSAELIFFYSDLLTFKHERKYYRKHENEIKKRMPAEKAKCVIWDLDNTLWDGIIGDIGIENIKIRGGVVEVIKQLDQIGILQSVCSKNDYDIAWKAICQYGLDEYFLYPQINWDSKSLNIRKIEKCLNINADTFVFIDDSWSERCEVLRMIPEMRVYPDSMATELLKLPEFNFVVTSDAKNRRKYYMEDLKRDQDFLGKNNNYCEFIRSCNFQVTISKCEKPEDIDRCYELIKRTNQLNASSHRMDYFDFKKITENQNRRVLKIFCKDHYGEYGTVGCIIMEERNTQLLCTDFVMSCRMAKKKVESGVISKLMDFYGRDLSVVYFPTERNKVLLEEFVLIGGKYCKDKNIILFEKGKIIDDDWVCVECEKACALKGTGIDERYGK